LLGVSVRRISRADDHLPGIGTSYVSVWAVNTGRLDPVKAPRRQSVIVRTPISGLRAGPAYTVTTVGDPCLALACPDELMTNVGGGTFDAGEHCFLLTVKNHRALYSTHRVPYFPP
jgi:hypothetical protein